MRAAKVQASLRIRAVSPEPSLLAHTSSESRGTFRQKTRSLAPLNGWACAVKICHDRMLEDTNSLDGTHLKLGRKYFLNKTGICQEVELCSSLFVNLKVTVEKQSPKSQVSPVKRICVFEHSIMLNFNCACPAIQRGQGSGFLSEGSS